MSASRKFIPAVLLVGFALLAVAANSGFSQGFDEAVLRWLYSQATPAWDAAAIVVTDSGGVLAVALITLGVVAGLLYAKRRAEALQLAAAVMGAVWLNLTLKLFFQRQRPDLWTTIITEQSLSFPSGHAMVSAALATALVLLFWRTAWRWPVVGIAIAYIGLVGLSRMYLGVHYPTDVMAGWTAGAAVALAVWTYASHRNTAKLKKPGQLPK